MAHENYLGANQALSTAQSEVAPGSNPDAVTPELCKAVEDAIVEFEKQAQNVDVDCLRESEATLFLEWTISIAAAPNPPC